MDETDPGVALVTGASSGIGRATAQALKRAGYRVLGTSRRAAPEPSGGITMLICDVTHDASVQKMVDEVLSEAGRIDLLKQCRHRFARWRGGIRSRIRFRQELAEAQPSAGLMSISVRARIALGTVAPAEVGREMRKPIVGVIGNAHSIHDILNVQHVGEHSLLCISEVADALPLMFAGCPDITDIDALPDTVDGILMTSARANVHPSCFGVDPDARCEPYDRDRDAIALPLIRACIDRGVPLLGICRGLQEMNVAFGGSLHPEVRDLSGRMNHRAPRAEDGSLHRDPKVVFADRHEVRFAADGVFARLLGCLAIRVNSLHGQAILEAGDRIVVEGVAEDGTIEAIRIAGASAFALGVQWHAEVDAHSNPANRALFRAFGAALREGNRPRRRRSDTAEPIH